MTEDFPSNVSTHWRYGRLAAGLALLSGLAWVVWSQASQDVRQKRSFERPQAAPKARALESFPEQADDTIRNLLTALVDEDPHVRGDSALALGRMGPAAQFCSEWLRSSLHDAEPYVRGHAALALARIDRDSHESATALTALLLDPERQVGNIAHAALGEMGPVVVPVVMPLLADDQPHVRLHAVGVLQRFMRTSPVAAAAIRERTVDTVPQVRDAAILALLTDRQATLSEVILWIRDGNAAISSLALAQLSTFGASAVTAVPELIVQLEYPRQGELPQLLVVLRSLKSAAGAAAPALLRLLESPVEYEVAEILETLVEIGADPRAVSPLLVRYLFDETPYVAETAGGLLSRIDPEAARRQAPLVAAQLQTRDRATTERALLALRGLGPQARVALPRLVELLRDGGSGTQELAAGVLGRIGPSAAPAVPVIVAMLERPEPASMLTVLLIDALGAIGPAAAPAIPRLLAMVVPPPSGIGRSFQLTFTARVRCAALLAAARIGVRQPEYLEATNAALSDDVMQVRISAMRALAIVGDHDAASLPGLLRGFEDGDAAARLAAVHSIVSAVGGPPEVVSGLVRLLKDSDLDIRAAAATALGRIGPEADAALSELRAALTVDDNFVPLNDQKLQRNRDRRVRDLVPRYDPSEISVAQASVAAIRLIAPQDEQGTAR